MKALSLSLGSVLLILVLLAICSLFVTNDASAQTLDTPRMTAPIITLAASDAFDTAASLYGFRHGNVEANPIVKPFAQSTPGFIAAKLVGDVMSIAVVKMLAPHHPKLARVFGYGLATTTAVFAANNLRIAK